MACPKASLEVASAAVLSRVLRILIQARGRFLVGGCEAAPLNQIPGPQRRANHVHVEENQMTNPNKRNCLGLGLLSQPADAGSRLLVKQLVEQLLGTDQFSLNRYVVHRY